MFTIHKVPLLIKKLFPKYIWTVSTNEKIIYLTFDDGPIPGVTEFVLDELDKAGAKATFFCVGENILKHPQVFNDVVNRGHKIGNHTFNHIKGWQVENEVYFDNILKCKNEIEATIPGLNTNLFRPPYGRIKGSQGKYLLQDYKIIMWDVLTCDYDKLLKPEKCLTNSIKATASGSIVVFHDSIKAEKNLQYVLPRYLSHFKDKGYKFESLNLL